MGQVNPLLLGAAAAIGLALLFIIIGLAAPNWVSFPGSNSGLFESCVGSLCGTITSPGSKLAATRAMVILGFIGAFMAALSCTALIVSGFTEALKNVVGYLPLATLISAAVGGALTIIGCIIFGASSFKENEYPTRNPFTGAVTTVTVSRDPDFAFILSLIGAIILIVGGVIAFKGNKSAVGAA